MPNRPKEQYPKKSQLKLNMRTFFHGQIPEITESSFEKGKLTPYKKGLINKHIIEISNNAKKFKIGVTGDLPIRIDDKVYRSEYDRVEIIYKCKHEERAKLYEMELIEKFIKMFPDKIDNKTFKKSRPLVTYDYHYKIYVVYSSS